MRIRLFLFLCFSFVNSLNSFWEQVNACWEKVKAHCKDLDISETSVGKLNNKINALERQENVSIQDIEELRNQTEQFVLGIGFGDDGGSGKASSCAIEWVPIGNAFVFEVVVDSDLLFRRVLGSSVGYESEIDACVRSLEARLLEQKKEQDKQNRKKLVGGSIALVLVGVGYALIKNRDS